jgi:hypothetical protein
MARTVVLTFTVIGWISLAIAFLSTCLLTLWHMDQRPFANPGSRMTEGAILIWMVMIVRWLVLAVGLACAATRAGLGWWTAGVLLAHLLLGLLSLWVWDRWVSVIYEHTPAQLWALAIIYLSIPLPALLGLAVMLLRRAPVG